jgi:hypothetical protein
MTMTLSRFLLGPALFGVVGIATSITSCGGSTDSSTGNGGAGATGGGGTGGTGGSSATGGTTGSGGTSTGGVSGTGGAGGGSGACSANSDCSSDQICGFATADGCSAQGECFPAPGMICNAYSPGCACDGTEISIVCTGLPAGYTAKPLQHAGTCDTGKPFPCGPSLTCDPTMEFCKVGEGGAAGNPPSYSCETIPQSCAMDPTCACIQTAVGGQLCSESNGGVTVTFEYP